MFDWRFPDPPHKLVYLVGGRPLCGEAITYVSHHREDAAWQFLGDSLAGESKPVLVCFRHPIDGDPSLKKLADLPLGWWAERSKPGDPWARHQDESDEEE